MRTLTALLATMILASPIYAQEPDAEPPLSELVAKLKTIDTKLDSAAKKQAQIDQIQQSIQSDLSEVKNLQIQMFRKIDKLKGTAGADTLKGHIEEAQLPATTLKNQGVLARFFKVSKLKHSSYSVPDATTPPDWQRVKTDPSFIPDSIKEAAGYDNTVEGIVIWQGMLYIQKPGDYEFKLKWLDFDPSSPKATLYLPETFSDGPDRILETTSYRQTIYESFNVKKGGDFKIKVVSATSDEEISVFYRQKGMKWIPITPASLTPPPEAILQK